MSKRVSYLYSILAYQNVLGDSSTDTPIAVLVHSKERGEIALAGVDLPSVLEGEDIHGRLMSQMKEALFEQVTEVLREGAVGEELFYALSEMNRWNLYLKPIQKMKASTPIARVAFDLLMKQILPSGQSA